MTTMENPNSQDQLIYMAEQNDVPELAVLASKLAVPARRRLLAAIEYQMNQPDTRALERARVALAKLLIAMVPDSWRIIRSLIQDRGGTRASQEVRFSLFCFLDELPRLTGGRGLTSEAASLVGDYLRRVQSNTGHAAWMAGDLLGDHWDPSEGVPILIDVLTSGKYAEGRLAALHGLEHAMAKADCTGRLRDSIRRAVSQTASNDRSGRVRESAKRVSDGVSACSETGPENVSG